MATKDSVQSEEGLKSQHCEKTFPYSLKDQNFYTPKKSTRLLPALYSAILRLMRKKPENHVIYEFLKEEQKRRAKQGVALGWLKEHPFDQKTWTTKLTESEQGFWERVFFTRKEIYDFLDVTPRQQGVMKNHTPKKLFSQD